MLVSIFDNYSDLKVGDYSYSFNHHAYYDHSCKNCVKLYKSLGYPRCCCKLLRFVVCLGPKCFYYDPIIIKPGYHQLSLFD